MKKIILFIIFFSTLLSAQIVQENEQIFNFSDEFNHSIDLTIGKNPWATEGLDTLLGEEFVPQVPPGQFGARFQLPPDTSITTIKDIRFGCYWATAFYHLIDLSYVLGSSTINVEWTWGNGELGELESVWFSNPYTGEVLAWYTWSQNPEIFEIPSQLDKIQVEAGYGGTLSIEDYKVLSPNGGETLESDTIYPITWESFSGYGGLNIEFSSDSGTNWNLIVENYWSPHNSYEWLVPLISSENCLIRLGNYPCVYDLSDSVFTITYPVSAANETELLTEFSLSQNYPNPFNPSTKIKYTVPAGTRYRVSVQLKVYDILGNEVATLVNEEKPPGEYEVEFSVVQSGSAGFPALTSGISAKGGYASGVYFYQLRAGSFLQTKKMVLIK